ncbi:carboxylesterase/lipase family protein [Variovorax sp. ZT4R33]|uniref:carboxylesterase/lipase family protein n=1 Tax=Variovorax sp. ZT4R33 TaxID=3443743 RepID=UPI003F4712CA
MIRSLWRTAGHALWLLVALQAACWAQAPTAATPSGPVQGRLVEDVAIFRGIPFAAPPVGDLRWREPQPVAPWSAMRQTASNAPSCPQKRGLSLEGGGDPGEIDEDCLYLNVFTPVADAGARQPVMVWIHGGALVFGSGGLEIYDGSALAKRGVVVVTINYRLGPLGFFAHPALDKERPGGPTNFGLLDQIAALQWVQKNIESFGGDPARVTVFGQSAGAQSVLALMASPLATGLFRGAIAESPYGVPSHTRAAASASGTAIATKVGLPGAGASMAAMRGIPAERLAALEGKGLSLAPGFVVGDRAVPMPLLEAFQKGRQAGVPLIIGSNSDDASVAVAFGIEPAQLVQKMGRARILVRSYYPDVADDRQLGREVARDVVFTAFARRIAYLHSATAPTWRYYFSRAGSSPNGAGHGAEVPFVHGTVERCQCLGGPVTQLDRDVARRIGDRWAAFASAGTPAGLPTWERDNRSRGWALEIGDEETGRSGFMAARLNAFITGLNLVSRRN